MPKSTLALVCGTAGLILGSLLSNHLSAAGTSYGEDRAQIEDLQARYLFALDFHDSKLYASTFTPDGILDYGEGDVQGREAIIKVISGMPGNRPAAAPADGTPALSAVDRDRRVDVPCGRRLKGPPAQTAPNSGSIACAVAQDRLESRRSVHPVAR